MSDQAKIIKVNIEEEMKSAYIDYSMSVIVSRALPDVRDGLKPVHRRVLFGMSELGVLSNRSYKKSARIVGRFLESIILTVTHRFMTPWCAWPRNGPCAIRLLTGRVTSDQ
jgi:hypothetical protein